MNDVLSRRANTTHTKEDVVVQKVLSESLDLLREGSAEHKSLSFSAAGHIFSFHNLADLRLETHIEHAISLIQDQVLDQRKRNSSSLQEVHQTARSGHEDITSSVEILELLSRVGTSIDHNGTNRGSVGELSGFLVDLHSELSRWGQDEGAGIDLSLASSRIVHWRGSSVVEHARDDREQERGRLSGTGLSATHKVSLGQDNWNRVLLDGRGLCVSGESDVVRQNVSQIDIVETLDGLGGILAAGIHWDFIVLIEVDASVGILEEFRL